MNSAKSDLPAYDVCAAVAADLTVDARVWKEAITLRQAGHSVVLVGCRPNLRGVVRRREAGIHVIEIPWPAPSTRLWGRETAWALSRVWAAVFLTTARVYHAHNIHVFPACRAAARRAGAKVVYDAHELYGCMTSSDSRLRRLRRSVELAIEASAVRGSDEVITTNPSRVIALQARHGLRHIEVLANVPRKVPTLEPWNPGFPDGVPILLYQGGIYAELRAFRQTIQALQLLDGVHLVLLGFGTANDLALVQGWAKTGGVDDRVHLLPPQPFERLVHTASLATVGLVPIQPIDLAHYLGDTNKLYEYLMAGLPVIASDIPEIRKVVTQGTPRVGELFDPADAGSIAAAYLRVTRDATEYQGRRREARRLALESHHWELEERRLRTIYARLLGRSKD